MNDTGKESQNCEHDVDKEMLGAFDFDEDGDGWQDERQNGKQYTTETS
jgi:hypothetical protein